MFWYSSFKTVNISEIWGYFSHALSVMRDIYINFESLSESVHNCKCLIYAERYSEKADFAPCPRQSSFSEALVISVLHRRSDWQNRGTVPDFPLPNFSLCEYFPGLFTPAFFSLQSSVCAWLGNQLATIQNIWPIPLNLLNLVMLSDANVWLHLALTN